MFKKNHKISNDMINTVEQYNRNLPAGFTPIDWGLCMLVINEHKNTEKQKRKDELKLLIDKALEENNAEDFRLYAKEYNHICYEYIFERENER